MKLLLLIVFLSLFIMGCVDPLPELNEPLPLDVVEMSRCIVDARRAWLEGAGEELWNSRELAPGIAAIAIKLYEIRNDTE